MDHFKPATPMEIVEENIFGIYMERGGSFRSGFVKPAGQRAKWFQDELGQIWCKFETSPENDTSNVTQHVIPASRVVEVMYKKERK